MSLNEKGISNIFIYRAMVHSVFFALFSVFIGILGIYLANNILISSINDIYKVEYDMLTIIEIRPLVLLLDFIAMLLIISLSSVLNYIALKKVKPIMIIKAKE